MDDSGSGKRRPWALILLGFIAFAAVLLVRVGPSLWANWFSTPETPVTSSAAAVLEPMAVLPNQTGVVEPPGVAKPLQLFAVTVGRDASEGLAVLGPAEASARTYLAGALLENGSKLAEVFADHVVLTRGAERYRLYLPESGKPDDVPQDAPLTVGDFPVAAAPLAAPPMRVTDYLRAVPVYQGGLIAGFTVYPGSRRSEFEQWGLKPGDVLLSLGGQSLSSPDQVEALMEQLASGASLSGEVLRGKERLTVSLDGNRLVAAAQAPVPPSMPRP